MNSAVNETNIFETLGLDIMENKKKDDNGDQEKETEAFIQEEKLSEACVYEEVTKQRKKTVLILNTVALYAAYWSFGILLTSYGPALLDLEELLRTDTKSIVYMFTFQSVGFIVGAFVTAFIIGKIDYNILLLIASVVMVTCLAIGPWMPNLAGYIAFATVTGIFSSGLHTVAQVYLLVLWGHSKHKDSLMQGMHGIWSVAATIGPFVMQPFLSGREEGRSISNATSPSFFLNISNAENKTVLLNTSYTTSVIYIQPTTQITDDEYTGSVQFGFLTLACMCMIAPILCFVGYLHEGGKIKLEKAEAKKCENSEDSNKLTNATWFKVVFVLMACTFLPLYVSTEVTLGNLIATFVVKGLRWEKYKGALITSVYWGTFGLSRLLAIVLARRIRPVQMIVTQCVMISVSLLIMVVASHLHEAVTWLCMCLIGIGEGPFFAASILFVNQFVPMNGPFSAALTVANAAAIMVSSVAVGYIFETYGHMTMMYYTFTCSVLLIVVFIIMYVFATCFNKVGKEASVEKLEVEAD